VNAPSAAKPRSGLWHWSPAEPGDGRLAGLEELCHTAAVAGLDYIAFKSHDGADDRYLTDAQLERARAACAAQGLGFVLWQYVYAVRPPSEEATSFAATVARFQPDFVFIDVEIEYERATGPVSRQYAEAFRAHLPHFPAAIAPLGRADLHPGIDWKAWHDHGFAVAPQAYECESGQLTPAACAKSFAKLWPVNQQWTVVGLHKGNLGKLDGAQLAASVKGLPLANVSGWYSGDFTADQLRGIATHHGSPPTPPLPAFSVKTAQQQLAACGFGIDVTGELDDRTREALKYFQTGWCGVRAFDECNGNLTPATRLALAYSARNRGSLGRKAKNFTYHEFRLDNRGDPRVRRDVALAAQAYRDKFGPTTILRSASSREHNKAVGGAPDSRHLFPDHWDAIDVSPQNRSVDEIRALRRFTGVGHHSATGLVDHLDLRTGYGPDEPSVFPDH
jgi:Peptidase M15/Putative peptidoglycan binding domain